MLRVELGYPRAAPGRSPKLFGDGSCSRDWMGGYPGVFGSGCLRISPLVFSLVFRPLRGDADEAKTHLPCRLPG